MSQFQFDPITFVNEFNVTVARWQDQAKDLARLQQESAGTDENEYLSIAVQSGQILDLTFTDAATNASPVQLRSTLLEAYHRASARANERLAQGLESLDMADVAAGVRDSAPQDVKDAAEELSAQERQERDEASAATDDDDRTTPERLPWSSIEELWADAGLDDEDLTDIRAELAEIAGEDFGPNESQDWQGDLDRDLAMIAEQAKDLPQKLGSITGKAECKQLTVAVSGFGQLTDVTFRPAAANATAHQLTKAFQETYEKACTEVSAQIDEALPEESWPKIEGLSVLPKPDKP